MGELPIIVLGDKPQETIRSAVIKGLARYRCYQEGCQPAISSTGHLNRIKNKVGGNKSQSWKPDRRNYKNKFHRKSYRNTHIEELQAMKDPKIPITALSMEEEPQKKEKWICHRYHCLMDRQYREEHIFILNSHWQASYEVNSARKWAILKAPLR